MPVFTTCPSPGGSQCGGLQLTAGSSDELIAKATVPNFAPGTTVTLAATATGDPPDAPTPGSGTGSFTVKSKPRPAPTPSPTPSPRSNGGGGTGGGSGGGGGTGGGVGSGGILPPGSVSRGGLAGGAVPLLPNPTSNAGSAFPQLSPSGTPSPKALTAPDSARFTNAAARLPLDMRLIGGQVVGLAILAAGLTLAVARLSLRRRRPQEARHTPSHAAGLTPPE
jgi:hypothetical protein